MNFTYPPSKFGDSSGVRSRLKVVGGLDLSEIWQAKKKRGGGNGYGYVLLLHLKKSGYPPPPVSMPIDSIPLEIIRYPNI